MLGMVLIAAMVFTNSLAVPETKKVSSTKEGKAENGEVKQVLSAVEGVLRGDKVSDIDLKNLDKAVIRLESAAPETELRVGRGVEGVDEERLNIQRNVYILRFDTGRADTRDIRVLKIQREILKNQLSLLKSLNTIARHQMMLGSRTARVENKMIDMTLGMKVSGREMKRVRGETAGTGAEVKDIAYTTTEMSETLDEMSKNISDIEGAIEGVDMAIGELAKEIDLGSFETSRAIKKMGSGIESMSGDL